MASPPRRSIGLAACLSLAGCTGTLTENGQTEDPPDDPGLAFEAGRDRIELLPFPVRLRRVADVVGIGEDDLLLTPLRDRSMEFGHHNFAVGVRNSPAWDAPRIAAWTSALKPICESDTMKLRYQRFPDDLDELMTAAYGRVPPEEEVSDLWTAATESGATKRRAYVTTCLAVLSSLEFVAR